MKYRNKPVVIEAIQWTGKNANEIAKFADGNAIKEVFDSSFTIHTLEGTMKASVGDYIIKGVNGEFYPCKPDIFEKIYDKVDDELIYGGKCGGGMSHHINTEKINENELECPVCSKPVYLQERNGVIVCSDPNCEYGHIH